MQDPALARDRAHPIDDARLSRSVDVPSDLRDKLEAVLTTTYQEVGSFAFNWSSPRRAESFFVTLTNAQRLAAELVEHTHQSVGLPVPADVAALLGRPASSLSSLAPANAAPHTAAAGMPSAA
jgi:hypothetical protein